MKLNLKGIAKAVGRGAAATDRGLKTFATEGYAEGLVDTVQSTAKFVGKHAFKKEDKTFWNAYTGLKETNALKTAAWAGTAAWGIGSYTYKSNTLDKSQGNVTYANEPAATTYDYVASSSNSLGASGSMVFGLHNGRKG